MRARPISGGEAARRGARLTGWRAEWFEDRLRTGRPLSEQTTAAASQAMDALRQGFLKDWRTAVARWQAKVGQIAQGVDPWDGGAAGAPATAAARALAELEADFGEIIDAGWKQAYRMGYSARTGSAPTSFSQRLTSEIANQIHFAQRFAKDIAAGKPEQPFRMPVRQRSELYAKALNGGYNAGAVDASPGDELIWWRLGAADHCTDCPVIAASSPYTQATLPSLPGDGATECRSNCACFLEFLPSAGPIVRPVDAELPFEDGALKPGQPPPGLRLPTTAEQRVILDMESRMNYARRMVAETAGTAEQAKWIRVRRDINQQLIDYNSRLGIWHRPTFSVGEVIRGQNVSPKDVGKLVTTRGLDGNTAEFARRSAQRETLTGLRNELNQALVNMPDTLPGGVIPDFEDMLIKGGVDPRIFQWGIGEAVEAPAPERLVLNAVGWGARATVEAHVVALETLAAGGYAVEVGPFDGDWLLLVLTGGTWISGASAEVRRFVDDWLAALDVPPPMLARWQA